MLFLLLTFITANAINTRFTRREMTEPLTTFLFVDKDIIYTLRI